MSRAGRVVGFLCCAILFGRPGPAADRYDPRLHFRTITTPRFYIHYHQGEEDLARRLARIAEETHDRLTPVVGRARSRARTHVILVDQDDLSNGWARSFPYNVIQLNASPPDAADLLGNTDDWLRLVFTHEYTHVLHLDRAGGLMGGLRYVFGRAPLLFPNQFLPVWQIEGIATWSESTFTGLGRIRSGDFREIVGAAARSEAFEPIDRVNGGLVDWPDGHAPYAYGGLFHAYLAKRYSDRSLGSLADATGRRLPFLPIGAFKSAFGDGFGALWSDFRKEMETEARRPTGPALRRLTHDGYVVGAPRWSSDGTRIFFSRQSPHEFPSLMSVVPGDQPVRLVNRRGGVRTAVSGGYAYYDQLEYVRSVGLQSDLYRLDLANLRVERLTSGARALDADVSPDGSRIACVIDGRGEKAIALFDVAGASRTPTIVARGADTQYGAPRWAPDGAAIAAERRVVGGPFEIVVVDPATGALETIVSGGGRNAEPEWTPDGRWILFTSDRDGGPLDVYAVERRSRRLVRLTSAAGGARAPSVSPDGRSMALIGYTIDGYDIFTVDLPPLESLPSTTPDAVTADAREGRDARPAFEDRTYNPWTSLHPRYWTPVIEQDNDRIEAGVATTGGDALGRHSYAADVRWGSAGAHPDWRAAYVYDRWRPAFFAFVSEDRSRFQNRNFRDRAADAGLSIPFRRVLRLQTLTASVHASEEAVDRQRIERRALRGGWLFTTARTYGYSISPEDGLTASVTGEAALDALGSSGDARTVTAQIRGYPVVGRRHVVLAIRAAAAASWGDRTVTRVFGAGGSSADPPGGLGRDAIGLLRGYDVDDVVGARVAVVNADLRVPIRYVERGVGRWPLFVKALHAAAFVDAADAWERGFDFETVKLTYGAEISVDTVLGFSLPMTFAGGIAWRHDGAGRLPEGAVVFGRIGRAF
jgi:hypothetical protein